MNSFLALKEDSFWGKSDTPIWIASSFFLERNLPSDPFPAKLNESNSRHILTTLQTSLMESTYLESPKFFEFDQLTGTEREFLFEHFLTSCTNKNPECKTGVVIDKRGNFIAIINGENHLTLHSIESHSGWKEAWQRLSNIEEEIETKHLFAYSPKFGYLTSDTSSLGTGLTVQAFLHLPCLVQLGQIDEILIKDLDDEVQAYGLTGNSDYIGDLIVIQNRFTLGLTENHILESVHKTATRLVNDEKSLRIQLKEKPNPQIIDKISRAIGLIKHSYQIETKEALNALSFIKLGIDLDWVKGLNDQEINKIFFEVRRGHLSLSASQEIPQEKLAQKRAEYLQSALKPITLQIYD